MASKPVNDNVYDVLVIGAGPAGCEASAAACRAGAAVLTLCINVDTIGLHPGSPVIAKSNDDPRFLLLEELSNLAGLLPLILRSKKVAAAEISSTGMIAERRRLSLAYQEALQFEDVEIRQALVTSLRRTEECWVVDANFGERFKTACVVMAAGTFLGGVIEAGNSLSPGGRRGEIPANALARCLDELGLKTERVRAVASPHLDSRSLHAGGKRCPPVQWPPEIAPSEIYGNNFKTDENCAVALSSLRADFPGAWITRAGYTVHHQALAANQIDKTLEAKALPGLFFAGRAAGCMYFSEAAVLGAIAGKNAACRALGRESLLPGPASGISALLCGAVAHYITRPASILTQI